MMRVCIYCREKQRANSGISFFPFPRNTILRNLWMKSMPDLKVIKSSVLCSKHFVTGSFSEQFGRRGKLLKIDAVPTLFSTDLNYTIDLHKPSISQKVTFNKEDDTCSDKSEENVDSELKHNPGTSTLSANTDTCSENSGIIDFSDIKPISSSLTLSETSLSATLTAPSDAECKTSPMEVTVPIHLKKGVDCVTWEIYKSQKKLENNKRTETECW